MIKVTNVVMLIRDRLEFLWASATSATLPRAARRNHSLPGGVRQHVIGGGLILRPDQFLLTFQPLQRIALIAELQAVLVQLVVTDDSLLVRLDEFVADLLLIEAAHLVHDFAK